MTGNEEKELLEKVRDLHKFFSDGGHGHTFIIIMLVVLLIKSCV
jgi:hypothetical protein